MSAHGRKFLSAATGLITCAAVVGVPATVQATQSSADLTGSVRTAMLHQNGDSTRHRYEVNSLPAPLVESDRRAGSWAFGSTTVPVPSSAHATPTSSLFVAHRLRGEWQVGLEGTSTFDTLARRAPATVVSAGEKDLFARNAAARSSPTRHARSDTGLGLPWKEGDSWLMGGGPHGDSGAGRPYSSVDFNGGSGRVLSAGEGRVYRSCERGNSALVKVVHANGFSTTYYHMYNLTDLPDGSSVGTGTYLGHIGNELPCGGSSSGAHVHFSLLRGNSHISVHGRTIGGWTFHKGNRAYAGYAERGGTRVSRGGRLTNFGGDDGGLPAATVNSGRFTWINVRSGPGLDRKIVGNRDDGAVVRIRCTARGDTVEGVWGATDLWNRLQGGGWMSDGFVDTGSNDPAAPPCD